MLNIIAQWGIPPMTNPQHYSLLADHFSGIKSVSFHNDNDTYNATHLKNSIEYETTAPTKNSVVNVVAKIVANDGTEDERTIKLDYRAKHYLYVSHTGSDTTGDGSQNNPFATIGKAIAHEALKSSNHQIQGLCVMLYQQGNVPFVFEPDTSMPFDVSSDGYVEIDGIAGLKSDITSPETTGRWKGISFHFSNLRWSIPQGKSAMYGEQNVNNLFECVDFSMPELDATGLSRIVGGPNTDTTNCFIKCTSKNLSFSFSQARLCRDCVVVDTSQQGFNDCDCVVNCRVDSIQQQPNLHGDVWITNTNTPTCPPEKQKIIDGLTATKNIHAQGLFPKYNLQDSAIINANIDVTMPSQQFIQTAFSASGDLKNVIIRNCSFTGVSTFRDPFTAEGVLIDNCNFNPACQNIHGQGITVQ
jgi:hypothetical protein